MHAFLVDLTNKPGALADIAEALGKKAINIENVAGAACGDSGRVALVTADDVGTRAVIAAAGLKSQELEITDVNLGNTPGSLGQAARRLSDAGVNIEAILPMGMSGGQVTVGFVTSNPAKAKEILATAAASR